jgi:hypothetical protein
LTIFGSKEPSRSRGTVISTGPTSVRTVLERLPLRELPIVRLAVDDVVHDGEAVLLRLGEPASPVPEPAASLLLDYIADRDHMNTATNQASPWLFPGPGGPALPPRPPVRTPQRDRRPGGRRPRRRYPTTTL